MGEDAVDETGDTADETADENGDAAKTGPADGDPTEDGDESDDADSSEPGGDDGGTEPADESTADGEQSGAEAEATIDELAERLDAAADDLDAAEDRGAFEAVAAALDEIEAAAEAAELVDEPLDSTDQERSDGDEDEDEDKDEDGSGDAVPTVRGRIDELRSELDAARGPDPAAVAETVRASAGRVGDTRWTESDSGAPAVSAAVERFAGTVGERLDLPGTAPPNLDPDDGAPDLLRAVADATETLERVVDADTLTTLDDAVDKLDSALDDAEEWADLTTREQLDANGFYDVLGHYKDFPPEWAALKEHERRGNAEAVVGALDAVGSPFMEEHCLEALGRLKSETAFEPMHERAERRDRAAIRVLGKIGSERAVDTLVEYVDGESDPQLLRVTYTALGEIGSPEATPALVSGLGLDEAARPQAARALGLVGDTRAVDPLDETVDSHQRDEVRAAAAWALRQIGTRHALERAANHADDRSVLVAHEAERAAAALG